jgi:hypothetical protein
MGLGSEYGSSLVGFGGLLVEVIFPLVFLLESTVFLAFPFGTNEIETLLYWSIIVMFVISMIPYICFVVGITIGNKACMIFSLTIFFLALIYRVYIFIYLLFILVTCDGDLYCADNYTCDGIVTGAYTGPTIRYLIIFSANIFMEVVLILCVGVSMGSVIRFGKANRMIDRAKINNHIEQKYNKQMEMQDQEITPGSTDTSSEFIYSVNTYNK